MTISSVMVRSWTNQTAKLVGGKRALALLGGLLLLFAVVFGYLATREFVYPMLSSFPTDAAATLMALILTNASLVASSFLAAILMMSPSQTTLDNILATKPVRRSERTLGYLLPLIATTVFVVAVIFSPVVASFVFGNDFSLFEASWVVFVATSHALYVVLLDLVLYLLILTLLFRVLAAGHSLSQVVAASSVVVTSLASFAIALSRSGFSQGDTPVHPLNVHVLLIEATLSESTGKSPAFYLLGASATVLGLLLLWVLLTFVADLSVSAERPAKRPWLRRLPFGRHGLFVFLSQELKQAARHTENFLFTQLYVLLALALVLYAYLAGVDLDHYLLELPLILWLLCALFAHNSYGRTRPYHWLLGVLPKRRSAWLTAKVLSNIVYCGLLTATLFSVFSPVSDQTTMITYLVMSVYGVLFVLGITLAGTLLPYSEEYPFSSAFSALLATVFGIPLSYVFQKFSSAVPDGLTSAAVLACTVALALLIYLVDRWRARSDGPTV